jgi:hypothetical protein
MQSSRDADQADSRLDGTRIAQISFSNGTRITQILLKRDADRAERHAWGAALRATKISSPGYFDP